VRVQLLDSSEILESFYKEARKLGDLQKLGATLQVLSNTTMGLQSLDQHCLTIMGNVEMCAQLAGLFTTYVILNLTDGNGQPALLYIVPFTLGTVILLGWWRKELKDLWNNEDTSEKLETLTQSNEVQKN
jgi:hypothetical protein